MSDRLTQAQQRLQDPHAERLREMAAEIVAASQQNRPARQPKDGDVSSLVYGAQCVALVQQLAALDPSMRKQQTVHRLWQQARQLTERER